MCSGKHKQNDKAVAHATEKYTSLYECNVERNITDKPALPG